MAKIQERGRLIAGSPRTASCSARATRSPGKIEGFDIDMIHAVAQAIFGDPNKHRAAGDHRAAAPARPAGRSVDIVARNMTINCARWKEIAFSTEYYRSGQKVLVRARREDQSGGRSRDEDLAGKKVCAPNGSTSLDKLRNSRTSSRSAPTPHTGCLVLFQQGEVDAITGDDTVLAGLAAQDPYAEVVQAPGSATSRTAWASTRPTSTSSGSSTASLAQMQARRPLDGAATRPWLADALGKAPGAARPVYGRDAVIAATPSATAPRRPGRIGQRPGHRTRCATSRRSAPGATQRKARARPCSTRRRSGPRTRPP